MSGNPIIRLDRVSKVYSEGAETRHVLHEASVSFAEGEIMAIRGRSGSGKSTLLNLVAGIDSPTTGEVWVAGTCINRLPPGERTLFRRDHLGFVFQFFNLLPTLTVLENLLLPLELTGAKGPDGEARALALLERVGLADRRDTFPDLLSGGEQQRIALARALVHRPGLLLADEPTGNLDQDLAESVGGLLEELAGSQGTTLVVVTHSRELAARMDRTLRVDRGHLVEGTP